MVGAEGIGMMYQAILGPGQGADRDFLLRSKENPANRCRSQIFIHAGIIELIVSAV